MERERERGRGRMNAAPRQQPPRGPESAAAGTTTAADGAVMLRTYKAWKGSNVRKLCVLSKKLMLLFLFLFLGFLFFPS